MTQSKYKKGDIIKYLVDDCKNIIVRVNKKTYRVRPYPSGVIWHVRPDGGLEEEESHLWNKDDCEEKTQLVKEAEND